jgi:hypothetical protein
MIGDIVSGVLVDVIAVTGRRLGLSAAALRGRRHKRELDLARWFDTYKISGPGLDTIQAPAGADDAGVADVLGSAEVHAVLHELLAARLTGAAEADVGHVRAAFSLTISAALPRANPGFAGALFGYYDSEICGLVARLRATRPELLREVRDAAFGARMVAILHAIERHVAALSARPGHQTEADFLARYRRHVTEHHGMLEPPDFERRRRVPVSELYVAPAIVEVLSAASQAQAREVTLEQFTDEVDRTVLLGDPGSGKTTASHVLMYRHASTPDALVPFLVTLREFTSGHLPQRSVAGYLQDRLESFYQCPAPPGTVERLLLSGAALIIFDGIDELTDPCRRGEVAMIIERFCTEYPLARVLVTSRSVGYEQARLDDRQFTLYRIGGFDDDQVAGYVRKWFAQEDGLSTTEAGQQATAFLAESASVPDLLVNPLILALMCVLYRGEGSIPRNRPEVYEQCSNLLLRKWDGRRHIDVQLRAASQAEPATRHLAYWLLTRGQDQQAVTERELLRETTAFLRDRNFDNPEQAGQAAQEFIAFCRDRAWVFSNAGTTAAGQRLYTFTHRTFQEYFAAAHLAASSDTPEELAHALAPRIARQEWEVIAELAIQIKCASSDLGEERTYATLLSDDSLSQMARSNTLQFLARCTRFLEPPPRTVRDLTRAALDHLFAGDVSDEASYMPLSWLLVSCLNCRHTVKEEIAARATTMISSPDPAVHLNGLRLSLWIGRGAAVHLREGIIIAPARAPEELADFWDTFARENAERYAADIAAAASSDEGMLYASLRHRFRTAADVLALPGSDLTPLITAHQASIFGALWTPYLVYLTGTAARAWRRALHSGLPTASQDTLDEDFTAVGRFLLNHPKPPWASICLATRYEAVTLFNKEHAVLPALYKTRDATAYLGAAVSILTTAEATRDRILPAKDQQPMGSFSDLYPYILRRWGIDPQAELPSLPLPQYFQHLFAAWADKTVNFINYSAPPHP